MNSFAQNNPGQILSSLAFIGCFSFAVLAHADAVEDEDMLSMLGLMETDIATGTPLQQRFTPAVTSIVTAAEIQRNGARTLYEALEQVPGLHIYPSKNFVMKNNVSIRGIQTSLNSQVLILVNGVRQNSGLNGSPALHFMIPTSSIQRIEVIRGPGSALYGADAFSGVINVITKKYEHIEDQIGGRYGSFNSWESWLNTRGEVGDVKMGLLLTSGFTSIAITENESQRFAAQLLTKPYRKKDLSKRIQLILSDKLET